MAGTHIKGIMRNACFSLLLLVAGSAFGRNVGVQSPPLFVPSLSLPQVACANGINHAQVATEAANPKYHWTVNGGTIVKGQGTAAIDFTLDSSGTAAIAVSIEANGVLAAISAIIPVYDAPFMVRQPQSALVMRGTSVTLTAEGSIDVVDYGWFEGVSGDTSKRVAVGVAAFKTPPLSHTTAYWVRVTGQCGTASSDTAVLTVGGKRRVAGR